jgi:hypothetical protein
MGFDPISAIADAAGAVSGIFTTVLNKIVPDANLKLQLQQAHDAEVAAAATQAAQIQSQENQAEIDLLKKQLDVDLAQAGNANLFVSGARPFAMWLLTISVVVLSFGLLYLNAIGKTIGEYFEVFFALLGFLGALFGIHTYERHKGVAPEQPDGPNVPSPSFSVTNTVVKAVEDAALPEVKKIAGKYLRA